MENTTYQKFKLGIFVIIGLGLFLILTYLVGNQHSMLGNNTEIYANFNNINGLKEGNNVRFSGINVGTVKTIQMISDTVIIVKIAINKDISFHIKKDAKAVITTDGLVGNMIINIISGGTSRISVETGDTIYSFSRVRTDEMLNTLSVTNENAAVLTEELLKISKEISNGKGVVGSLISDPAMTEDLKLILINLRNASLESSSAIKNVNLLVTSLDKKNNLIGALRDTSMANQITNIMASIEKSSKNIEIVVNNLNSTILNANEAIKNLKDGPGAINYLSNDETLVKKIDNTVVNLDSTIMQINAAGIRLNENLEALKHNWLLRGYFKKLEKEKTKK
jgi:phospholipid/cholesterol/gamma-HCH transport system substrate-binding protein